MSNPQDPNSITEEVRPLRPQPMREPISRKKACQQCSVAKVRCDHKKPQCTRCESRRINNCDYAASQRHSAQSVGQSELYVPRTYDTSEYAVSDRSMRLSSQNTPNSNGSGFVISSPISLNGPENARSTQTPGVPPNIYWPTQALNFGNIDLICMVDSTKIGNRWLGDFMSAFDRRVKNYPPSITLFISRVLKTYPTILLRAGYLPPFVHSSQMSGLELPTPLANCLSLVRMWDGQVRGSENMVREIVKNEMSRLYDGVRAIYSSYMLC